MYLYTHITFPCSWVDNILEENPGGTLQTRSRPLASSQLTLEVCTWIVSRWTIRIEPIQCNSYTLQKSSKHM